ncbi:HAD-IB family phosphatase [Sphingomonas sp. S1-29]|uniref:HAD family hydrolase n=1 Tax=Sphingomonas sp. S1-29 TaxID=2991074 RepID=UPI00223FC4A4|nr:HAD-IB family phosphatase [Sphingomonas sp. S1-29]UZK68403.1 HAD-IB family phosphatase [Sphingomonas sp. S1-29]
MAHRMMRLAIYDMDKTVTRRATWTRFLVAGAASHARWRLALLPVAGLLALGHPLKLIDRSRLKHATQRLMLGPRLSEQDLARLTAAFAEAIDRDEVLAAARAQIAADRAAGYRLVLATASYRYYAEAIAARLGFDAVVATEVRRNAAGDVLSGVAGDNCYGPAKLAMIEAWMAREGIARAQAQIRFYSDHVSDAPALRWADEAFAVNAHAPLTALAAREGWEVLDWR